MSSSRDTEAAIVTPTIKVGKMIGLPLPLSATEQ